MASRSSNKTAVPEAKGAMNKFKYEVASELGVPLTDGYNGDLTSKQNGSVGGYIDVYKRQIRIIHMIVMERFHREILQFTALMEMHMAQRI